MQNSYIIFPMFAMVLLTFFTLMKMVRTRFALVKSEMMDPSFFGTYQDGKDGKFEHEDSRVLSRHFSNLFEAPVLFYVVCLAALATQNASTLFQGIAWLFVLTRLVHSYIHLTTNIVMNRVRAYAAGWLVLLALWLVLIIGIV